MIIVTGATGQLGGKIVENLLKLIPANEIGVSVRDPEKAINYAARGVRVRQGDFNEPDGLKNAFEGANQLLLVSSNASSVGGDPITHHKAVIAAARDAGVGRIVYTSQMAASATSAFPPMHDHATTENLLDKSGLAWTALRNGFYGASALMMMRSAFETGELETIEGGKFSWATHDDLAEAAVKILVSNGQYDGPTAPLTGSEALDFNDLVNLASEVLNKPIHHKIISDEEMRTKLEARGMPSRVVGITMGMFVGARNGEWAKIDPTLNELLGRSPIKMKDLIASAIAA